MAEAAPGPSAAPELSVLIVTYRNPDLTRDCLTSVFAETRDIAFEVLVVDNESGDGTPEMIEREFPAVRLIRAGRNLGFAGANNLAARDARGEHLVLLNPDTVVLDRALERLLAFARAQPGHPLVGGRTLRPTGELDPSSCWGAQTPWSLVCFATGLSTAFRRNALLDPESLGNWARDSVRDVGVVTGCLALLHRKLWAELGGFDERFFMYGEDADLSLRARSAGHRVCITPDATIVHVVGASSSGSGGKMTAVMRARATMVREHWPAPLQPLGLACLLTGVALRAGGARLVAAVRRRPASSFWLEVWRTRASWRRGYPPAPDQP